MYGSVWFKGKTVSFTTFLEKKTMSAIKQINMEHLLGVYLLWKVLDNLLCSMYSLETIVAEFWSKHQCIHRF